MPFFSDLLNTLPAGNALQVTIGLHWTAVVTEVYGLRRCGLASTLFIGNDHHNLADVPNAGELEMADSLVLAAFAQSGSPIMRSVGIAAINSLLQPSNHTLVVQNAEEIIAHHGKDKNVVLVGRFPFIPRLKNRVRKLTVLEINPLPGEFHPSSAQDIIPTAEIVAITGMSLINCTFENLLDLCSPQAFVILLGPSAPLSPVLFDYGIDVICGSIVIDIEPVLKAVSQGANFRQVHQAGVRLISMTRDK